MFFHIWPLVGLAVIVAADQIRINCGGPQLPAIAWRADTAKYRSKPSAQYSTSAIVNASGTWRPVYQSHAYATSSDLSYKIPVNSDVYTVFLLFSELYVTKAKDRVFSVTVNGIAVNAALDVFAVAGGLNQPLLVPVLNVKATGGFVTVTLGRVGGKQNPMISGIVIDGRKATAKVGNDGLGPAILPAPVVQSPLVAPTPTGTPRPRCDEAASVTGRSPGKFSMNAGGAALTDFGFGADNVNYIVGDLGKIATSGSPVLLPGGANAGPVYLSERYTAAGALTYKISMPPGSYKVSLMYAETYHNSPKSRVFNIVINGISVRSNVDIFDMAGKNKAKVFDFPNVPSVDGGISISFTKVIENPFVNGIMITGAGADTEAIGGREDLSCMRPNFSSFSPTPARSIFPSATPSSVPSAPRTPPVSACATAVRVTGRSTNSFMMNCGGPALRPTGYGADNVNYIVGARGKVSSTSAAVDIISGSNLVYLTARFTTAQALTYKIPMPSGVFSVTISHAETDYSAAAKRVFDIRINGVTRRRNLDVFVAAGGQSKALLSTFAKVPSVNGFITVQFIKVIGNPFVNGIRIVGPGADRIAIGGLEDGSCGSVEVPTTSPSKMMCHVAESVTGIYAGGTAFLMNVGGPAIAQISAGADNVNYILEMNKGIKDAANFPTQLNGTWEPVYLTSRYTLGSSLTYRVPAPKIGAFTVGLLHMERFFNKAGARVFNVAINGKPVLTNLDVFARVGKNRRLYQQFTGIRAPDGYITIKLKKVVENPFLSGIFVKGPGIGTVVTGGLEDGSC